MPLRCSPRDRSEKLRNTCNMHFTEVQAAERTRRRFELLPHIWFGRQVADGAS